MVKLSKERMDYTIDLLIAMVVEEIAEETGKDRKRNWSTNTTLSFAVVTAKDDVKYMKYQSLKYLMSLKIKLIWMAMN